MKNRANRNALGGCNTRKERDFYQSNTRYSTENRLDSNRATVLKYNGSSSKTYDIKLLYSDVPIKNVACVNIPSTPYTVGKEVKITYPHGLRQQPMIDGGIFAGHGSGGSNPRQPDSASEALSMAKQTQQILSALSIVIADTSIENKFGSGSLDYLLSTALIHADLTGVQLHEPKSHDHSGDTLSPTNLTGTDYHRFTLLTGDRSAYEIENTMLLYNNGIYSALCMYINSSWQEIKRFL